ncbi:Thiolase protein [Pyrenophora tritici-repentis]|nr:Thiolase protein [Pyrenophora tritici-repentis]
MKRQCMLYFPATSQDGLSRLYKLQHASKSNHMLKKFLQSVHRTLRKDVTEFVYPSERARLGDCDIDLFLLAKQQQRHPYGPIQMILTLSIQLAELVLRMTSDEIDGVLAAGAGIGLLSGALSAVVHDSWDVVQLSQYIVSLAFRFGIELERRGRNIDCSESAWESHVMVIESLSQLESELNRVNLATPVHLRAYAGIISVSNKTATLFGPPSTLAKFKDPDELKSTCLYGPATMFAPHLQPLDVVAILQSIPTSNCTRSILRPVVSPTDGKPYEASNFQDLLIQVLNDIAGRRVDMDCLTAGIVAQRGAESADLVLFGSDPDAREVANAVSLIGLPIQTVNRTHISSLNQPTDDAVAVIGMAGRFPESDNVEELWSLLESGTSTAKKIPPSRFLPNEETAWDYTGHFIKRPGVFDHALFAISPVEAMQMDPIQRMALLTTYEALEMAGYSGCDAEFGPDPSRVAVFFGQTTDDWKSINQQRGIDMHYLPGLNRSFTPGRISRYFGWSGGFYSIDTGCSSSATCLCLARDALLSGQIDMAIVGGGNLLNTPEWYQGLGKGGFLSATGACKTFAESADGYCRGEAVGVVVLKRQEDALRAKDNILASITSASRNANARTSASLTAPSQKAQEVLYGHVLRETGICPSEVDYVEMHGTGTQLGDSIEMAAVANVLAEGTTLSILSL